MCVESLDYEKKKLIYHGQLSLGNALNIILKCSTARILRAFYMLKRGKRIDIQGFSNLFDHGVLLLLIYQDQCSMEHTLRKVTPAS